MRRGATTTGRVAVTALAALIALACACTEKPNEDTSSIPIPTPAATLTAMPIPTPAASPGQSAAPAPSQGARAALPCRALGLTGRATWTGMDGSTTTLGIGGMIPTRAWVALEKDTKLQTKDPTTGRELAFDGPAALQPCRASAPGDEEAWVRLGSFTSSPSSGEAPGQEEWVVTPLAVVRYIAASVKGSIGATVNVRVGQGAAWIWPASDAHFDANDDAGGGDAGPDAEGWARLGAGAPTLARTVIGTATGKSATPILAAREATAQCQTAARAAAEISRSIATRDASGSSGSSGSSGLGDLAVRHVVARRKARAACAIAGIRASGIQGPEGASLAAASVAADQTWRALFNAAGTPQ